MQDEADSPALSKSHVDRALVPLDLVGVEIPLYPLPFVLFPFRQNGRCRRACLFSPWLPFRQSHATIKVIPALKAVEMSMEAEVVLMVDQQARERALKLTDNKIQHGVYEALKTMGLNDAEAYKAMIREAPERVLPNAN